MATKKTSGKIGSGSAKSSGSDKPGQARLQGVDQVDDPIIIKGGSIWLSFDRHNFRDVTSPPPNDQNKRFDHAFRPNLTMLKIIRGGAATNINLQPGDTIKICYEGSTCDDTLP